MWKIVQKESGVFEVWHVIGQKVLVPSAAPVELKISKCFSFKSAALSCSDPLCKCSVADVFKQACVQVVEQPLKLSRVPINCTPKKSKGAMSDCMSSRFLVSSTAPSDSAYGVAAAALS